MSQDINGCFLCVACVYTYVCVCMCGWEWRSEVDFECLLQSLSTLFRLFIIVRVHVHMCAHSCTCVHACACHRVHVKVRGQLSGMGSLFILWDLGIELGSSSLSG